MVKKKPNHLKIEIEKNILDIEHNKKFNLFLTCTILATTVLGLTFSIVALCGFELLSQESATVIIIGGLIVVYFIVKGDSYRKESIEKFEEIKKLSKKA